MDILGQPMIVVNSYEMACELLDKRSATFSGRPKLVMAELYVLSVNVAINVCLFYDYRAGMEWMLVLMQYGKEWRRHRRAFHQAFHSEAVVQYQPLQLQMTRRLLSRLLKSPKNIVQQLNLCVFRRSSLRSLFCKHRTFLQLFRHNSHAACFWHRNLRRER